MAVFTGFCVTIYSRSQTAIIAFDEREESLKTAGYLELQWRDEYLKWDPDQYDNIYKLFLPQEDIWKPDLSLRNTYKTFTGLGSSYLNVEVDNTGLVYWIPFQVLESTCAVDTSYFPFDVQTCTLKFTAWSYSMTELEIHKSIDGVRLEDYVENSSWGITETYASETTTDEAVVYFIFKLKRKSGFYIINIIIPVVLLSVLSVLTFILPVSSGEKASYAVTVFLSLALFMTIVTSELPKNSENTSLLAVYMMVVSIWSTLIVTLCLVESRIYTRDEKSVPINAFFMALVKSKSFFTCQKCAKSVKPEVCSKTSIQPYDSEEPPNNWRMVVDAMDFVFFWISFIVIFVCTLVLGIMAINVS
ncbi:neuronal acetylcholine receptor subunit beta-2-like isoform X2 [Mercenaria mercenaria]|uniref:neuronal acetylcholine receptor subunit beta-2-like isoform X2 n=1 Tax=Mercenaria mercenaria TaxID=6596 RepID=UPI00234F5294|nr:neuronal acetylcholine receptor subunit beta-2-like isoform X2 [Mercenaria mercenaria]